MRNRILALAVTAVLVGSLAGCTTNGGGSADGGGSGGGGGGGGGLLSGCDRVHIVVARGTFEPAGTSPFGAGPFANALALATGGSVWDVPYRADLDYLVAPGQGATKVVNHLRERASRCPNENIVLTGYSKGAMVQVLAMPRIPAGIEQRVKAVVLFGNPFHDAMSKSNAAGLNAGNLANGLIPGINIPPAWRGKTRDYCLSGDPICGNGINIIAHLTYSAGDTAAAVSWAQQQLR
jgi:cutinase